MRWFGVPVRNRTSVSVSRSLIRRPLFLIGGLLLIAISGRAQPDTLDHRFATANEAYAQGRYKQAVEAYETILDAGYESAALYHNLGNAYVRLDRMGPAIWAYERGRRLRPNDPRLRHNLEYVRRQEGLPLGGMPPRGLAALVAGWSPLLLFGLGWLTLGGGLVVAVLGTEIHQAFGRRSPFAWGPVVAGLLLVVVAGATSHIQTHDRRAVVTSEQVSLREAPGGKPAADTTLRTGAMLEVDTRRKGWVRVRLRDQSVGWVPREAVKEV